MPAMRGNFVRAAEWRRVRQFTSTAADRPGPAALVIAGEAGSGKSRLWRGAVAAAAEAGVWVLRSEPSASEADIPFAGLHDLLAGVVPLVADAIPGPQREALEVALLLRPAGEQPPAEHAVGRGALAALTALLTSGPVVVAVDDVQWLDAGSLDALEFALRRVTGAAAALSVLLAARTDAPADPLTVGAPRPPDGWRRLLAAFPAVAEVTLTPLAPTQVQELLPATATAAQARLVASQSRGNPFWAREIWASMATAADTAAASPAAQPPVPPLARAALARRLKRSLTPAEAEALTVVAAAGRITVPEALAALDHLADPATALDAAVLAGVVAEIDGRLAAVHPLIGAAAVEAAAADRRAVLYRRLAQVSAGPERRAQFAALAARAEGTDPDPAVADALDAAAEAAYARTAYAAAGKFAAQAVTFTPPDDGAAMARRRIRAGELLDMAGELDGAVEQLQALDMDTLPTADLERALPRLIDLLEYMGGEAAAIAMITRALGTASHDERRRALLLALASDPLYGVRRGRRAAADEAIRCAEAAGPAANRSLHKALINLAIVKVTAGEGVDTELLDRAERLEDALPRIPLYDTADHCRAVWYRYTEDLDASRAAQQRCMERARETGDDFTLSTCLSYVALTDELSGDYTAAAAAQGESEEIRAWYGWPESPWLLEPRCELLIASGDLAAALRLVDEHLPEDEGQPLANRFVGACLRGKISAWSGAAAATAAYLEVATECADELGWADPGTRAHIDRVLAEAYVATGQPEKAAPISARLRDLGARMNRPALTGQAHRIDALAALAAAADNTANDTDPGTAPGTAVDLAAAAAAARDAVAAHENCPLRPELARSLLVLGRIERRREDLAGSRATFSRARDLAREIGHRPLLTEIEAELPRAAVRPRRSARLETTLTGAEERVAEQLAKGASNREAAAELFLSVRTVETHVASIYRKLGVRTRSELRRVLAQR